MLTKKKEQLLKELLSSMGLITKDYYGKIIINFQAGNIICYGKEETIKRTE